MMKLIEASGLEIREVAFEDGKSAVHYLAEVVYGINDILHLAPKVTTLEFVEYFLNDTKINYQDSLGYTYFHGACMAGNVAAVNLFISQGVDVNLGTYKYSALHIAAQYRHEDVVEILLRHGADASKQDAEESTPLHALARLCLCRCTNAIAFCDRRRPVDKIVKMLVDRGANIEARDRDGNSPLDMAVSRFDTELTRSLLKYGAILDGLNEDTMFGAEFTSTELKNYPLALNIIETMQLLQSAEYRMSLHARFRMIKCFEAVRGDDTDHLTPEYTGLFDDVIHYYAIANMLFFHRHFGLYIRQEAYDFLDNRCNRLKKKVEEFDRGLEEEEVWEEMLSEIGPFFVLRNSCTASRCVRSWQMRPFTARISSPACSRPSSAACPVGSTDLTKMPARKVKR
ncbi:unnamed protein product [Trichogramma brassicae]|uniref:Uncharacterized protein n=1 Tax=Trichogramma brassicae TaxID=86971 RepID=A0A6H5I8S1_9HYME|nr:unnamed protein product [Trichogramma brassicae]